MASSSTPESSTQRKACPCSDSSSAGGSDGLVDNRWSSEKCLSESDSLSLSRFSTMKVLSSSSSDKATLDASGAESKSTLNSMTARISPATPSAKMASMNNSQHAASESSLENGSIG
ncbi:hypothetical protein O1611_g7308 [Lasiodiplodia mahajangana]|uniref:Uncharacterized protein n=1 Tax=Lasiodiplodia mahajangana TaxID=1108764 RepID=A0ACC2JFZ4_9PEZI|nr:hypothetical protein O1611_g7308 [Lasiodiplodia mahajangana]